MERTDIDKKVLRGEELTSEEICFIFWNYDSIAEENGEHHEPHCQDIAFIHLSHKKTILPYFRIQYTHLWDSRPSPIRPGHGHPFVPCNIS